MPWDAVRVTRRNAVCEHGSLQTGMVYLLKIQTRKGQNLLAGLACRIGLAALLTGLSSIGLSSRGSAQLASAWLGLDRSLARSLAFFCTTDAERDILKSDDKSIVLGAKSLVPSSNLEPPERRAFYYLITYQT